MVYDRELKRPAQLGKDGRFGERLTKEQAEELKQRLTDDLVAQPGTRSVVQPTRPAKRRRIWIVQVLHFRCRHRIALVARCTIKGVSLRASDQDKDYAQTSFDLPCSRVIRRRLQSPDRPRCLLARRHGPDEHRYSRVANHQRAISQSVPIDPCERLLGPAMS